MPRKSIGAPYTGGKPPRRGCLLFVLAAPALAAAVPALARLIGGTT
jgi:hypothetical protein